MLVIDKTVIEMNSPSKTQSVNENVSRGWCSRSLVDLNIERKTSATRGSASILGHTYGLAMTFVPSFQWGSGRKGSTGTLQYYNVMVVLVEKQFQQGFA
jgi:hypothetical protein